MKKLLSFVLLGVLILVLTACGSNNAGGSEDELNNTLNIEAEKFNFGEDEFRVKSGEPVTIHFSSTDGIHGLAIDEFDININEEGTAEFTPESPGEYTIYCSVFCGSGHEDMNSTLIVEE